MQIGIDFGSSVTDAVMVQDGEVTAQAALHRPGPAGIGVLRRAIASLGPAAAAAGVIGVTGGRSRELPTRLGEARLLQVAEPTAIGRGGLRLAGVGAALVVSCGTGTAMVAADQGTQRYQHVTGTPIGGGTLEGLGTRLLGLRDASAVAALAERGDAGGVDTTLADVLGAGVGDLPPRATAASLAKLAVLEHAPAAADLAAGLVTMVAQTIALLAMNGAKANGLEEVVFVGRVAEFPAVMRMMRAVFEVYAHVPEPRFPAGAAIATALGAALASGALESSSASI